MELDIRTLIFVLGLTHIIQLVVFIHQYSINKTFRGVGWWLLWSAAEVVGFTFMLLRGIPSVLTIAIIGQNALIVAGVIFLYISIMRFFDKKENWALVASIFAVFFTALLYFLFVHDDAQTRGIIISATLAIVSFLSARVLLVNKNRAVSASANFISTTFIVHGCYHVFRIVMLFIAPLSSNPFTPTLLNVTTYLDAIIAGNIWTFGFIIMINQRLNAEATEAKEEIELVFNTSPDAVVITRMNNGLIVNVNEGFVVLSGFTRAEAIGKTVFDINIWKNPDDRRKITNELRTKGFSENFEAIFQRKDGSQLFALISAKIINLKDVPHIISVTRDITERKRSEEAAKREQVISNAIIESIPGAFYMLDENGRYVRWNAYQRDEIVGRPEDLVAGSNAIDTIHPDDRALIQSRIAHVLESGMDETVEGRVLLRGGPESRWLLMTGRQMTIDKKTFLVGIGIDITERKRTEDKLRESEEKSKAIANYTVNWESWFGPDGKYLWVNPAVEKFTGYSAPEILAMPDFISTVIAEEDRAIFTARMSEAIGGSQAENFELRYLHKNGTKRWLSASWRPIFDAKGKFLGARASGQDITERKRAEAVLQSISSRQQALLTTIPEIIVEVDKNKVFTWMNPAGLEFYGGDVLGKEAAFYFEGEQDTYSNVAPLFGGREDVIYVESWQRRKDGEKRLLAWWCRVLKDGSGNVIGAISTASDITERKKAEEMLVRAKEEAEKANRAKSEFLSSMSHELRTPLNPILGFTELMQNAPNLTDEQRTWMGIVRQRGKDLLELISAVLDHSKIEANKMVISREPLALRATVQEMIASVTPAAEKKGLRMEWDVSPDVPEEFLADGLRLRQIILNLLNNALKFTPSGSITMRVQDGSAARLGRPPDADEAALLFSVRDTGIGIPADWRSAIFAAFTQTDRKQAIKYGGGGAGLGLTIAQSLVELMDGKIWVESSAGQGSTFFFTVVVGVNRTGAVATDVAQSTKISGPRQSLKILVVEDDATSRLLAEIIMRQAGHTARTAEDGRQALACMEAETFDIVLMDIQMPVMDGIEATQAIREKERRNGRHTVVIALTAYAGAGDRERFIAAGMDGYVSKPISIKAVADAIANIASPGKAHAPKDIGKPVSTDAPVVVFDAKSLSAQLSGDGTLIRKVANTFLAEAPKRICALEKAIKQNQGDAAARLVHTIKGSAATVEGNQFRAVALKLETACKAGYWPEAEALIPQLSKQFEKLELAMREFLKTLK